ncbi:MAG: hypothetical protein HKO66_09460 [Saprospiraceae bacterium]|nr:hypothetical protein [Bacteroidia bacterium]NNE15355.1 hypothetical protein [Saprospiraceae bacterium]NNL92445.1 hypothetical protein [Saprospiraceae bacterium]
MKLGGLILLLFWIAQADAQIDSHYWTHQYGAKGLLLNGAVIASAEDETNIFYNPGAISQDDNLGFAFSFLSPTYSRLQADNFLGDKSQIADTGIDFSPGFLAIRFQPFNTRKLTFGIASFKRFKSNIEFKNRLTDQINDSGLFLLRADLDFKRKVSEDWFGIGVSYNITDNIGIGVSQFSAWHSESLRVGLIKEVFLSPNPTDIVASWRSDFDYNISTYSGFVTKVGLSSKIGPMKIGATFTTPTYGILRSSASYAIDDQRIVTAENRNEVLSNRDEVDLNDYKTPYSIGLGLEYTFNEICVSFSTEYFGEIEEYTLFSELDDSFNGVAEGDADAFIKVISKNQSVLNMAFGIQYKKNEKVTWLGGLRSDFNQDNSLILNNSAEYLGSAPDIFHISGGGMFRYGKNVFSIGLDFGFGHRSGAKQLADLNNVNIDNLFSFSGKENVDNTFFSGMLFITYDFIYNRIK